MTPVGAVLIRTSVVLLSGLLLRRLLTARSAAVRHGVLAATLLGAAAVVPISFVTPSWTITLPAREAPRAAPPRPAVDAHPIADAAPVAAAATAVPRARGSIAALVWALGVAVGIGALVVGLIRLARLAAGATRVVDARWLRAARSIAETYRLRRAPVLLQADAPFLLATWGLRPARVLLPPDALEWSDQRIHAVLCHELAHVARADWIVQLAGHVVLAALWFNPLAWVACRQLRRDSEQACDDAVLRRGVEAADYAGHLVALAREGRRWSSFMPAIPMARRSAFERRIAAMLNPRLDRRPFSRRIAGIVAAGAIAFTLAIATVRAVQGPPSGLSGTVYDPTGGVMPGVQLTLEDAQQHQAQATTDASGRFAFPGIGSGRYVLSAALPGFRTFRDQIELKAASDWDRVLTLQIGTLQETVTVSERRIPAGGTPAPAASAPVRVRVGGNIRVPRKLVDVRPVFPASMRAAGREGQVPIEAIIAADGSVSSVRVVTAQVHPDFAIAAVDAVRQWRFSPTLLNGQPVEVVMTVTVQFSLSD
jgi:TonB family protein